MTTSFIHSSEERKTPGIKKEDLRRLRLFTHWSIKILNVHLSENTPNKQFCPLCSHSAVTGAHLIQAFTGYWTQRLGLLYSMKCSPGTKGKKGLFPWWCLLHVPSRAYKARLSWIKKNGYKTAALSSSLNRAKVISEQWLEAGRSGPSCHPSAAPCWSGGSSWRFPVCRLNWESLTGESGIINVQHYLKEVKRACRSPCLFFWE